MVRAKTAAGYVRTGTCNTFNQERIKGTEKASPIHTLFHRYIRLELFLESG